MPFPLAKTIHILPGGVAARKTATPL